MGEIYETCFHYINKGPRYTLKQANLRHLSHQSIFELSQPLAAGACTVRLRDLKREMI